MDLLFDRYFMFNVNNQSDCFIGFPRGFEQFLKLSFYSVFKRCHKGVLTVS